MYEFYMPKKIYSNLESINKLILIYEKIKSIEDDEIMFNFSSVTWISGEMISLFGAITYKLSKRKKIFIKGLSTNIETIFQGNTFSSMIENMKQGKSKDSSIKFKFFKEELTNGQMSCFEKYLTQELKPKINLSENEINYIGSYLSEIFINARTHGNTFEIFCCGQKYPKLRKMRFMIVDLGVGIPRNVKKIKDLNDIGCILWSIKKGNTTKDLDKDSGGLGLDSVLDFVNKHNGNLSIISHNGQYNYKENICNNSQIYFDGTIVYIDFDYTMINDVDDLFKIIKKDNIQWNF